MYVNNGQLKRCRISKIILVILIFALFVFRGRNFIAYIYLNTATFILNQQTNTLASNTFEVSDISPILLSKATVLMPDLSSAWRLYGYIMSGRQENGAAIIAWQRSKGIDTELWFWSDKFLTENKLHDANRWIQYGDQISPEYGDWIFFSAILAEKKGSNDEALQLLKNSLGKPLLGVTEADIFLHIGSLQRLTNNPNLQNTLTNINKAIELKDFSKSSYVVDAHFERGEILRRMGKYDGAIVEYEFVISERPSDYWSYVALGVLYWELEKDSFRSEEMLKRAIRLRPDLPRAYEHLGSLYQEIGRNREAIDMYRMVLHIEENNWNALMQLEKLTSIEQN